MYRNSIGWNDEDERQDEDEEELDLSKAWERWERKQYDPNE